MAELLREKIQNLGVRDAGAGEVGQNTIFKFPSFGKEGEEDKSFPLTIIRIQRIRRPAVGDKTKEIIRRHIKELKESSLASVP